MGIMGTNDMNYYREGDIFFRAVNQVNDISNRTNLFDFQKVQSDVDKINKSFNNQNIYLSIYEADVLLYPEIHNSIKVTKAALSNEGSYLLIEDNNAVYSIRAGKYIFILSSTDFSYYDEKYNVEYIYLGIFFFVLSIIIVFIVNRILTRHVSKRITTPIEVLVSGVHELRDGNLNFRIEYNYKDEFKSVCDDFNEMAQHLYDLVTARQKDEKSRKELIAGISHDLRTPLTSIRAYIQGIEKGVASTPEAQQKYIDTIKRKTEDLERIINQLFLFSKLDIGEFPMTIERVEINQILYSFLNDTASEYESKGLSVSLTKSSNNLYTDIDVLQFRNVLDNILGNSVKYKINEFVSSNISCVETNENIVISIMDNGNGVPNESLEKLFDVFYRDDDSRQDSSKGSGLGLAITRKIIEQLNGTVYAKNAPESGLAIIITLPKIGGAE
jgi:signal transduction histidine kinase